MSMERLEDGKRYKSYHGYHEAIGVDQGIKTAPIQLPPPETFQIPWQLFPPTIWCFFSVQSYSILAFRSQQCYVGCKLSCSYRIPSPRSKRLWEIHSHESPESLNLPWEKQLTKTYPQVLISEGEARFHFRFTELYPLSLCMYVLIFWLLSRYVDFGIDYFYLRFSYDLRKVRFSNRFIIHVSSVCFVSPASYSKRLERRHPSTCHANPGLSNPHCSLFTIYVSQCI